MPIQGFSDNNIQQILAFRPRFEAHTSAAATADAGALPEMLHTINQFVGTLDQSAFTQAFDWQAFIQARNIDINNPEVLANADIDTLQKIITAHIRTDRFMRGHLESLVQKGYFNAFFNRLEALNK